MAKKPTYEELEQRVKDLENETLERKQAEEALRESEEKYRTLADSSLTGVFIHQDSKYVFVNDRFAQMHGYEPEELLGRNRLDLIHPDQREILGERADKRLRGEDVPQRYEIKRLKKDGEVVWHEIMVSDPITYRGRPAIMGHEIDVTEHKRAEEALKESEERFRAIFEQAAVGVGQIETETGRILRVNQRYCEIVGYTQQEITGITLMEITHPDDVQQSLDNIQRLIRGEIRDSTFEKRYVRKDGSIVWVNLTISPMWGVGEEPNYHIAVVEDITRRKQVEDALQESKDNLDKAQKIAHIGNWSRDLNLNRAQWSDETYRVFGLTPGDPAEISFEFILSCIHPEDRERVTAVLKEAAEKKQPFDFEFRTVPIEGSERIVRNRGEVEYDETGTPSRLFGTDQDITDRKQAEEALRESEKKFSKLFHANPVYTVFTTFEDGRFLEVNDAFVKVTGYGREEVIGRTTTGIGLWANPEERDKLVKLAKEKGRFRDQRVEFLKKNGEPLIMLWSAERAEIGGEDCFISALVDITDIEKAEKRLKESEELYRSVVGQASEGIFLYDYNTKEILETNKALRDMLGYTNKEMSKLTLNDFVAHEKEDIDSNIRRIVKEKYYFVGERKYRSKDGTLLDVEAGASLISFGGKEILCIVVRDITERKQTQEDLRKSEHRFKEMADLLPTIVCEIDMDLRVTYANSLAFETTGFTQSEFAAGIIALDLLHPGDREKAAKRIEQTLKGVRLGPVEYRILKKDGSQFPVLLNSAPIYKDGQITGIRFSMTDTSEQKELQRRLHRAQKMEALGLMAGGVAHDLNNILSGIVTYPELILMGLPEDSPLRKPLKTMQESGMKAADVVSDMLTIARGATISKEVSNLNTIAKGYLASVEHQKLEKTLPAHTFKTDLDPGLLNVSCSTIHIDKALMNLVTNASEAIEGSGTVIISTMNRYLDEPLKGYDDVTIGEYAVLRVSDDGSGILPDDLDRVFEPFYTKKEMGRSGTGLGLAVVWNTIQDHDGYVEVKSSEKGTIFELYFPVTRERMAEKEAEVPLEGYLGNGERILVVDDEERQREIASGLLTQLNYNVEAVSSGEEAIEYVKEHPVDLIVLDMVMPRGINGRETYEEIIKIRPGQKAIIASGYAKTKEVDIAQELGAGKYIRKPYILEKIGLAVKEELEK